MIDRLFLAHPRAVGESYAEHFGVAARFGATMVVAGLGALVHAFVPSLCKRTGSRAVERLYARLHSRDAGAPRDYDI